MLVMRSALVRHLCALAASSHRASHLRRHRPARVAPSTRRVPLPCIWGTLQPDTRSARLRLRQAKGCPRNPLSWASWLLACLLLVWPYPAANAADQTAPLAPADIAARLQQVYEATTTLQADFHQTTTVQMRRARKKEAYGTLSIKKPGLMRWDYREPEEQVLLCDGDSLLLYTAKTKQMTVGDARRYLQSDVTYAFFTGTGDLLADFDARSPIEGPTVGNGVYRVRLVPKKPHPHVESITVTLDATTFLPRVLDILDRFGGRTLFAFSNLQRNIPIPAARFRFTPPPGTEIIRQGP